MLLYAGTQLYIYGYIDRTPNAWHLAVSKNSSKSRFSIKCPKIKIYYIVDKYLGIGLTKEMYESYAIKIYNRERTICDVMRHEKKMDKEQFNQTIKNYVLDSQKNIAKLLEYAKLMNIEKKTKMIIGMWM